MVLDTIIGFLFVLTVVVFFHEFGHLIHHVFAGHTRWTSTANFREYDFVEAPSQLLEEWVRDASTLQTFAKHYETGAPIPRDIINLFVCTYNGTEIFRADLHQAISANPFITFFTVAMESGTLEFRWTDDNGQVETASKTITVE